MKIDYLNYYSTDKTPLTLVAGDFVEYSDRMYNRVYLGEVKAIEVLRYPIIIQYDGKDQEYPKVYMVYFFGNGGEFALKIRAMKCNTKKITSELAKLLYANF